MNIISKTISEPDMLNSLTFCIDSPCDKTSGPKALKIGVFEGAKIRAQKKGYTMSVIHNNKNSKP